MSEDKYCPLAILGKTHEEILNAHFDEYNCNKEDCAWYDDKNNQCILITIGRNK